MTGPRNVDSHAKNYSILLTPDGAALSPLYDPMSGLPWPGITQDQARAVGGQVRGRHIQTRHWRRMPEACGLAPAATVRRVKPYSRQPFGAVRCLAAVIKDREETARFWRRPKPHLVQRHESSVGQCRPARPWGTVLRQDVTLTSCRQESV